MVGSPRDGVHEWNRGWASQNPGNKILTAIAPCRSQLSYAGATRTFLEFGWAHVQEVLRNWFPLGRGLLSSRRSLYKAVAQVAYFQGHQLVLTDLGPACSSLDQIRWDLPDQIKITTSFS